MKKRLLFFCVLSLFLIVSCSQTPVKGIESSVTGEGNIENVKVTSDQAKICKECSPDSEAVDTPAKNQVLDVVSQVEDWYAVKMPDNSIGFIPSSQCTPVIADDSNQTTSDKTGDSGSTANAGNAGKGETPTPATANGGGGNGEPVTPKPDENANSTQLTADEQEMLNLVNEAREQNNVAPLEIDMEVTKVARIKSQDMIDNNYFSHNSPTYGSPFDMLDSFGIKYVSAGENIAGNQTVQAAHDALMNSAGHRKNILNPDYTHIGIGIKDGGQYGKMFTQQFISKPQ